MTVVVVSLSNVENVQTLLSRNLYVFTFFKKKKEGGGEGE